MSMDQANLWATVTTGAGKDAFRLRELWGEERQSGLFRFDLELESDDDAVDFSKVVGKPASASVDFPDGGKRHFHGMITRLRQGATDPGVTRYVAELRPWLWMLTQTSDCGIYQEMKTQEIIEKVFKDLGYNDFKFTLKATYQPREYCVQYRETAFDFVSRLMEEDGIHYFFEHTDAKHTLVMADDASAAKDCPELAKMRFRGTATEDNDIDVVWACDIENNVTTGTYALDDYSFEAPSTDLETKAGSGKLARYDYPGRFTKKADGTALAKVRLGALEGAADLLSGSSFSPSFCAGYKFTLADHPRKDVNKAWALRSVEHQLTQLHYRNSFVAFPADVTFRPPMHTARPLIAGTQTAKVVGKKGEEIWTDKFGRIKVLFHWDRVSEGDEKSSCWIRVTHGWAGKKWGTFFLPRIGQEVVVSFLDGDPDRPLVTGSVYNAEQTVPYALPANQTQSTVKSNTSKGGAGFNEIRFEDKKDSEEIYMHAQKDMTTEVLNDSTTTITKNRTVTVTEGDETHTVTKGKRTLDIKDDEQHTSQANFVHEVKGDFTLKVTGDLKIEAGGSITIDSKKAVKVKAAQGLDTEAGQALTNKAGTALTNQAGTALTNKAGTALTNKSGTALTNEAGTSLTNKGSIGVTNEGGVSVTNKGSATQTVDGGGMLTLKGGMVKIN
ncbi:MAG: type VI secretion system Vgr family protein [Longimicrobiales bacterium]